MPAIVHYEVYSYDVRGWTLETRYPSTERETAINEAKVLEMTLSRPVKVIRETYYTESNLSEETVTFVGRIKPQAQAPRRSKVGGYAGGPIGGSSAGTAGAPPFLTPAQKAKQTADFMFRVLVVMIGSLTVSVLGTAVASMLINRYSMVGVSLLPSSNSLVLFLIFLSLFLITAVPLVMLYVPLDVLLGPKKGKRAGSSTFSMPLDLDKEPTPTEDGNTTPYPRLSNPTDVVDAVIASQNDDDSNNRMSATLHQEKEAEAAKQQAAAAQQIEAEKARRAEEERQRIEASTKEQQERDAVIANLTASLATGDDTATAPAQATAAFDDFVPFDPNRMKAPLPGEPGWDEWVATQEGLDDDAGALQPQESSVIPANEQGMSQARLVIMKFLGGAVNAIKMTHPQLDAYNKFGVNLYMAGACELLGEHKKISPEQRNMLIQETVEVIGTRPEQARHMISRLDGYRKEGRYRQMINAGRVAMDRHIHGSGDPFMAIGGIMKDWNTPQSQQVAATSVTILFTDMVGSTDMTQTIGDSAAQDIIRAHNFIVRAALSHHNGKEVKHTGDGIMASFDSPTDAVGAAIEIQQRAREHNVKWPKLSLGLRIGMNTGEPIIEENDYFGTTVQIAARVCAAAGADQIWLSADTRALIPPASGMRFHSHGAQRLKGVKAPHELFEVLWTEERAQELDRLKLRREEMGQQKTAQVAPRPVAPSVLPTPYSPEETARAREAARQHLQHDGGKR